MAEETILGLIYRAHRRLGQLESTPRDYGTGELLYSSDIHTVEAVGRQPGCNLTQLAAALGVSKPAASKFTRKLLSRGFLLKGRQAGKCQGGLILPEPERAAGRAGASTVLAEGVRPAAGRRVRTQRVGPGG